MACSSSDCSSTDPDNVMSGSVARCMRLIASPVGALSLREMTMHRGSATAGAKLIPEGVGDGQGAMPISTRCSDRAVTTSGEVSSSTSIRRVGSYCRNEAMIAGRRLPDIEGTQPITSRPCRIAEMLRTVDKPSAISAKPLSTRFNKAAPASVRATFRVVRSRRLTPSCRSSSRTCMLRVAGDRPTSVVARANEQCCPTAKKARKRLRFKRASS